MLSLIKPEVVLNLLNALRAKLFGSGTKVDKETLAKLNSIDPVDFFTRISKL